MKPLRSRSTTAVAILLLGVASSGPAQSSGRASTALLARAAPAHPAEAAFEPGAATDGGGSIDAVGHGDTPGVPNPNHDACHLRAEVPALVISPLEEIE